MPEVTQETFKQAAIEAGERLRGGGEEAAPEPISDILKERIKEILKSGDVVIDDPVREISEKVASKIADMLWPEKSIEIKRKRAEMEVERGALIGYIKELLKEGI